MATIYLSLNVPGGGWGDCVTEPCIVCGRPHDKLWTVRRRTTAWGHFGVAQINKRDERGRFASANVIDGSLPTKVSRIPADAIELDADESARVWHEDNESHVFGGPNVAKALREAIAR